MEAIKLKEQIKMIEKEESKKHPYIIKNRDRVSKKVNMGDYTVVSPTSPIYPEINEHQAQFLKFSNPWRNLIFVVKWHYAFSNCVLIFANLNLHFSVL